MFFIEFEYNCYKENLVLIDFDYIFDNIVLNIVNYYNLYKLLLCGKIYLYFVKVGFFKLINSINEFWGE